jgi:hypothetical protein
VRDFVAKAAVGRRLVPTPHPGALAHWGSRP